MQLRTYFFALVVLLFAIAARAQTVQNYDQYIVPYLSWAAQNPADRELLNIFPSFKPPTIQFMQYGRPKTRTEQYHTYVTKMQVAINKNAANIRLADLVTLETVKAMDKELVHRQISADKTMPTLVGKAPIENFKWCNEGAWINSFGLPQKEKDLTYLVNPERAWCDGKSRGICIESCYHFSPGWKAAIAFYNNTLGSKDPKDWGEAMQSEIRYFVSEAEYGSRQPLAQLTKINTPVRGVMEQNIFYFNQIFAWGKIVAVFQEHPTNAQQTVMTVLSAYAFRSKYCTDSKYAEVCKVIKSESTGDRGLNTPTGISAGIKIHSQEIAVGLARVLQSH